MNIYENCPSSFIANLKKEIYLCQRNYRILSICIPRDKINRIANLKSIL